MRRSRMAGITVATYRFALRHLRLELAPDYQADAADMLADQLEAEPGRRHRLAVAARAFLNLAVEAIDARRTRRRTRAAHGPQWRRSMITELFQDLRHAVRKWRRAPAFAVTSLVTLALAIGLATAMFSVVDGVLLRPLPFQDADRLVMVWDSNAAMNRPRFPTSPANFHEWRQADTAFTDLSAYATTTVTISRDGQATRVPAGLMHWNLFRLAGAPLAAGSGLVEAHNVAGADSVVVLSRRLWASRYGEDPEIVGTEITIDGRPRRVVGVLQTEFALAPEPDFWLPLAFDFDIFEARGARFIRVLGRLAPDADLAGAQAAMDAVSAALATAYPTSNGDWRAVLVPVRDQLLGPVRPILVALSGAVVLVLMIACASVLNLQVAHVASRRQELSLRRALGAGAGRLVRQMVTESAALAMAGATMGLGLAALLTRIVVTLNPGTLPRATDVAIDARVLGFSVGLAVAVGTFIGLAAAGLSARAPARAGWTSPVGTPSRGARRLSRAVIAAQVAVAMVLLASFGLVSRSLFGLLTVDPGFVASGLVTGTVSPPAARYPEASQRHAFYEELATRLRALPAIDDVTVATRLPLSGLTSYGYIVDREPVPPMSEWTSGQLRAVDPSFFETMRIPLRDGRLLRPADDAGAPSVVVVNETMARDLNLGDRLMGTRLLISSGDVSCPCEVVGVVADVRETGLDQEPVPVYYLPQAQSIWTTRSVVIRSNESVDAIAGMLRSVVGSIDPQVPVYDIEPVDRIVDRRLAAPRFNAWLFGAFAALGLGLAAVSIYGVTTYVVSQRMQELAVRLALGARPSGLVWVVEREALVTAVFGLALGTIGAVAAGRFVESLLVNVSPTDTPVLLGTAGLLATICALSALLPALRASRTDPVSAIRGSAE